MKKIRLLIVGLVVALLAVSSAYAQEQNAGKPDAGKIKEGIYKELNLTVDQQQKLEANRKAQREKMMQLHQAMMGKEKQMREALGDPAVNRASVEQLAGEIKSLQGQLIDQRVSGIFAVKEILTPEQVTKLNQIMEKRREDRKEHQGDRQKRYPGMQQEHEDK
jgi:periplasmic protein CpxP/Spy